MKESTILSLLRGETITENSREEMERIIFHLLENLYSENSDIDEVEFYDVVHVLIYLKFSSKDAFKAFEDIIMSWELLGPDHIRISPEGRYYCFMKDFQKTGSVYRPVDGFLIPDARKGLYIEPLAPGY
jgi:hypothetical protein